MFDNGRYIDNMDVEGPMPSRIKEIFEALRYEVAWLHAKWSIYSLLFCRGEERLEFLDSMAPGFFVVVRADAQHIAIATVGRVDVLVSWNFKHIVNLHRIHGYNSVNRRRGYPTLRFERHGRCCHE